MAIATRQIGAVTIYSDEEKGEGGLERVFDAPRSLVWKVMTDPAHIPNWWGPRKYRTEVIEDDHRVGGKWRYVNIADDGGRHEFFGEYLEIVPEERVVSSFYYDVPGLDDRAMYDTLTLEDTPDGKTLMRSHSRFQYPEDAPMAMATGMAEGGAETWRAPGRARRRPARHCLTATLPRITAPAGHRGRRAHPCSVAGGQAPCLTSYSFRASRPCASRWTRAALSRSGASTRQKTLPSVSSTQ